MDNADISVHTLNARDSILLEFFDGYLDLSSTGFQAMVTGLLADLSSILQSKGVRYQALKSALVPSVSRREVVFVFDRNRIASNAYGLQVFRLVAPLLGEKSSHSVLSGDLLGGPGVQDRVEAALRNGRIVRSLQVEWSHQYYVVYLNNLRNATVERLHHSLSEHSGYVGSVDVTFQSWFKLFLSTRLSVSFVKHKGYALTAHGDDVPNDCDENDGYPFDEYDLIHRSVQQSYFLPFLSYKIERPVLPGMEFDNAGSLKSVHPELSNIATAAVRIDASKLDYLRKAKAGSLERARLTDLDEHQLGSTVSTKLGSNYIYNLRFRPAHGVSLFNMILEHHPRDGGAPVRLLGAFEYIGPEDGVRLITLY